MKARVLHDLVFVRPDKQPDVSDGGILMVYDRQRSTMRGTVLAIGNGTATPKGARLPHEIAIGDSVIFSPDSGSELMFEKDTVVALRENDILAVVVQE